MGEGGTGWETNFASDISPQITMYSSLTAESGAADTGNSKSGGE